MNYGIVAYAARNVAVGRKPHLTVDEVVSCAKNVLEGCVGPFAIGHSRPDKALRKITERTRIRPVLSDHDELLERNITTVDHLHVIHPKARRHVDSHLLAWLARKLDPAASLLGLTGTLLLAFVLSFPANELLLPLAFAIAAAAGGETQGLPGLLAAGGGLWKTGLCAGLFTLFHWPCSTTLLTVRHETGRLRWTLLALVLPSLAGILLCAAVNAVL